MTPTILPANLTAAALGFPKSVEGRLILLTAVAVAMAWIGLILWDRYRRRAALTAADPRGLFENLCEAHRLNDDDRGVLRRVATLRQLAQPAVVFVDPRHLRDAATASDGTGPACASLLRRLFGDLASA